MSKEIVRILANGDVSNYIPEDAPAIVQGVYDETFSLMIDDILLGSLSGTIPSGTREMFFKNVYSVIDEKSALPTLLSTSTIMAMIHQKMAGEFINTVLSEDSDVGDTVGIDIPDEVVIQTARNTKFEA